MPLINKAKKEINAKIVFFGPPGPGREKGLDGIHRRLKPDLKSPFKRMAVGDESMVFFDFALSAEPVAGDYRVRFHVYTLAGEASSRPGWKVVLKGADAVVVTPPAEEGGASWPPDFLDELLPAGIPLYYQYDLRDTAAPADIPELQRRFNPANAPAFVVRDQKEAMSAFSAVIRSVLRTLGGTEPVPEPDMAPAAPAGVPAATPAEEPVPLVEQGVPVLEEGGTVVIPLRIMVRGKAVAYDLRVSLSPTGPAGETE